MFPIQGEQDSGRIERPPGQIPWAIAELAYKQYSEFYGTSQSLEKLASRGGFGWTELVYLLRGEKIRTTIPITVSADHQVKG
jgi:hypothetical protein